MTQTIMTVTGAPIGGEVIGFTINGTLIEYVFRTSETIGEALLGIRSRIHELGMAKTPYNFGPSPENPNAFQFQSSWDGFNIAVADVSATGSLKAVLTIA